MARFLDEARKELEEEIGRSDRRKPHNKLRKPITPPAMPSNRVQDYDVVRLAPHKHILGQCKRKLSGYSQFYYSLR